MIFVFSLSIIGLVLIYLEFFLTGAIMAIGGALLLLASLLALYLQNVSLFILIGYAIGLSLTAFAVVRLATWRTKKGSMICISPAHQGLQVCLYSKELIGKSGIASSDLSPAGYVQIEDCTFAALSQSGQILKGESIRVVKGHDAHLIVTKLLAHSSHDSCTMCH